MCKLLASAPHFNPHPDPQHYPLSPFLPAPAHAHCQPLQSRSETRGSPALRLPARLGNAACSLPLSLPSTPQPQRSSCSPRRGGGDGMSRGGRRGSGGGSWKSARSEVPSRCARSPGEAGHSGQHLRRRRLPLPKEGARTSTELCVCACVYL